MLNYRFYIQLKLLYIPILFMLISSSCITNKPKRKEIVKSSKKSSQALFEPTMVPYPKRTINLNNISFKEFTISLKNYKDFSYATVKISKAGHLQFCELESCSIEKEVKSKTCFNKKITPFGQDLYDLPEGRQQITVACCIHNPDTTNGKKTSYCSKKQKKFFLQPQQRSKGTRELLLEKESLNTKIASYASEIIESAKNYLSFHLTAEENTPSEVTEHLKKIAENQINIGEAALAQLLSGTTYQKARLIAETNWINQIAWQKTQNIRSITKKGASLFLVPSHSKSKIGLKSNVPNKYSEDESEDSSEQPADLITTLKKPWITDGSTIMILSLTEISLAVSLFFAQNSIDNKIESLREVNKNLLETVDGTKVNKRAIDLLTQLDVNFDKNKLQNIFIEPTDVEKTAVQAYEDQITKLNRWSNVLNLSISLIGIVSLAVAFMETDMTLTEMSKSPTHLYLTKIAEIEKAINKLKDQITDIDHKLEKIN